ncbi:MAG: hypothetical protein ABJE66_12165 [Deltaproteobacteria bacterium]
MRELVRDQRPSSGGARRKRTARERDVASDGERGGIAGTRPAIGVIALVNADAIKRSLKPRFHVAANVRWKSAARRRKDLSCDRTRRRSSVDFPSASPDATVFTAHPLTLVPPDTITQEPVPAEFFDFAAALPSTAARRFFKWADDWQMLTDLVGPEEETIFSFDGDEEFDLATIARAYGGRRPAPSGFTNAFVEVSVDEAYERLSGVVVCEGSSGFGNSCFVVLDRVLAIPNGTRFLEGRALARIPAREVAEVARGWARLVVKCGGSAGVARAVRPYFSPGLSDGSANALRAIDAAFAAALAQKLDVLLFSCLP